MPRRVGDGVVENDVARRPVERRRLVRALVGHVAAPAEVADELLQAHGARARLVAAGNHPQHGLTQLACSHPPEQDVGRLRQQRRVLLQLVLQSGDRRL